MTHEQPPGLEPDNVPTQVTRPRTAIWRTLIAALVGLIPLLPEIAKAYGLESIPWVASTLAIVAATGKLLTLPATEAWLQTYAPWIAASGRPYTGAHRIEESESNERDNNPDNGGE